MPECLLLMAGHRALEEGRGLGEVSSEVPKEASQLGQPPWPPGEGHLHRAEQLLALRRGPSGEGPSAQVGPAACWARTACPSQMAGARTWPAPEQPLKIGLAALGTRDGPDEASALKKKPES